jgi:hypothetical protein
MAEVKPKKGAIYRANTILGSAVDLARAIDGPSASCQVPVILSAVFIEAFFNELEHEATTMKSAGGDARLEVLGLLLGDLEDSHASIRLKLQLSYFALTNTYPSRGTQPFQDFDLLVRLRDALVHPKTALLDYKAPKKSSNASLLAGLASRRLIDPPADDSPPDWFKEAMVPAVASWACGTAFSVAQAVIDVLPNSLLRDSLRCIYLGGPLPVTRSAG